MIIRIEGAINANLLSEELLAAFPDWVEEKTLMYPSGAFTEMRARYTLTMKGDVSLLHCPDDVDIDGVVRVVLRHDETKPSYNERRAKIRETTRKRVRERLLSLDPEFTEAELDELFRR